ncbi:SusC/RagA family TonB-linked outer membrane protein [Chitinophaga horti]|uniref:SusC/RagA family TonB-linked outer membrane protein n=1 Tax=Chitinophaga horti TaxID=2920382 RepID=A0ABY6J6T3_9BACT|nr:SusC/RagA family TonB-linked outer membrane protein [Chitinophaga horti]UYQ94312.1 SusC/RagA family TonB-linked outer membrane protein [Chitinophaga horti]
MMCCSVAAMAQQKAIRGKITDTNGSPVPGVTIREKGGTTATVSAADGTFQINVTENTILLLSSVGFDSQEVAVAGRTDFNISLTGSAVALTDVVVTALGVKREKRTLTYSTQQLSGVEIAKTKEPNLVNTLAGKIPGVQITSSSGTAGASAAIVIRGMTSVNGSNQALFVVDGVPINNDETGQIAAGSGSNRVVDIDPATIESVNVLKGAAATTLYGSAGARGVVFITTKNGGHKDPTVTLSSELSFEKPWLPERQTKYAQGTNGIYFDGETNKSSLSWGPLMDTLFVNGVKAKKYDPYDFFRTGVTTNSNISVDGGNSNSSYFASYSYFDQKSVMPENFFKRHSFFVKYNTKMGQYFNSTFQFNYANSEQNRLPEGASNGPLFVMLGQPISWNPFPVLNPDGTQRGYRLSRNMPYWTIDNISNNTRVNRFIPVYTLNVTPTKWLTITERLGADLYMEEVKYTERPSPQIGLTGQIHHINTNFRQFNNDLMINTHHSFGDFNLDVLFGNNIYSQYSEAMNTTGTGLTIDEFNNISGASAFSSAQYQYLTRKVGFYAQANLEYNRFISLALTGRYDGSSVLAAEKQFYPYGSVATSFVFSELFGEGFRRTMNFGKLRLSYATVGNDGVGPYALNTPYVRAGRNTNAGYFEFPFQGQSGFLLSTTLGNPNLTNERLNEYEAGLEMNFFKDRLTFEGSYFYRKSVNGIIPGALISSATGFTGTTINSAEIENKGIELLVGATPVKTSNFTWRATANFSRIRNKVLALAPGIDQLGRLIVGQPYNIFYGNRYERTPDGQLLIGANGLPIVASTQGIVGNANPDFMMGLNNAFSYKQFSLSFFFDWKRGGDVQNDVNAYGYTYGTVKATEDRGQLVIPGISDVDDKPNTVPVAGQTYWQSRQYESTIQDGTFIKLRNVSLSYDLNRSLLNRTPFKSASLSVTGRNLWIYAPHFDGGDPEVSSYGTGNGVQSVYAFTTPTSRSFNVALKIGF